MDFWVISAIVIGAILFIYLIYALLQPGEWEVISEVDVGSDRERLHDYLNRIRNWQSWTAWNEDSPHGYSYKYEGPETGEGATQLWKAGRQKGVLKITGGTAPDSIEHRFRFGKGSNQMKGEISLAEGEEGKTAVKWRIEGKAGDNPSLRLMAKLMKPYMQKDLDTGLSRLKDIVATWESA